jgi:ComF family protein
MRALIHEAKYHTNDHACTLLARLVELFQTSTVLPGRHIWIPIPLSSKRARARGYNQIECILQSVAKAPGFLLRTDVLERVRDTRPQTELGRKERLENVIGAFRVRKPDEVTGKDIVLIDDVMTTGATLRSAEAALKRHSPSSVTLIALSH